MGARATSAMDNNKLYTINTLHDKRAPHATATLSNYGKRCVMFQGQRRYSADKTSTNGCKEVPSNQIPNGIIWRLPHNEETLLWRIPPALATFMANN